MIYLLIFALLWLSGVMWFVWQFSAYTDESLGTLERRLDEQARRIDLHERRLAHEATHGDTRYEGRTS